ncbi:unnamed protein product [Heligmosomoides polygyrus]|uniref:C2H2-type domain-containing protein n=1 Tax=Heligmosomoides polygyrus TaxID=6339 RepID=A0A183GUJ6_HELPZ|nr:unnamed protein product [Heligmosomoides polygyrus]
MTRKAKGFSACCGSFQVCALILSCAYCPKTFATARGVREHERRSHESRLFLDAEHLVCPHCEQEFQNKRNRDEHVKRHNNPNSMIGRGF